MPAVRTTPKDVLIRVPKVEPYSNSYVPPSVRAKEEAKKAAATAEGTAEAGTSAAGATDASTSAPSATTNAAAPLDAAAALATPSATAPALTTTDATTASMTDQLSTATAEASKEGEQDRRERGNSPTLPFLSVDRREDQTVELSKAATSSAGWNSLLVWARRQRGAQWNASTALWQVDKHSREYYSFCEDPGTTDRSKQPGDPKEGEAEKDATATTTAAATADEDEDKGPTRVSARNRGEDSAGGSLPSAPLGRTVRLVRR